MKGLFEKLMVSMAVACAVGCATSGAPLSTTAHVDVPRYMGSWYVIANIPTPAEKNAFNAVENYAQRPDGTIDVTFTFHKGSFDGPLKTMKPRGRVLDASGAVWDMQFIWPIKADYRIAYLDEQYSQVIVGRNARDYVWIMARKPQLSAAEFERLQRRVADLGYDTSKLNKVPQSWH